MPRTHPRYPNEFRQQILELAQADRPARTPSMPVPSSDDLSEESDSTSRPAAVSTVVRASDVFSQYVSRNSN